MSDYYDIFEVYPEYDGKTRKPLYIIEFTKVKGEGQKEKWTLFQRSWIYTEERWNSMVKDGVETLLGCEGHPYNLLSGEVLPEQCIPNKTWLKWMVDQLNKGCE